MLELSMLQTTYHPFAYFHVRGGRGPVIRPAGRNNFGEVLEVGVPINGHNNKKRQVSFHAPFYDHGRERGLFLCGHARVHVPFLPRGDPVRGSGRPYTGKA